MNQVLAPYILGERLSRVDGAATGIIVVGIVLSTAFGVHTSANFTIEKLLALWSINLRACLRGCLPCVWRYSPKLSPKSDRGSNISKSRIAYCTFRHALANHGAFRGYRYLCDVLCGRLGTLGIFDDQIPPACLVRPQRRSAVHETWL